MAIRIEDKYPGNSNPADANYPEGSFKNDAVPGDLSGTPLEKDWCNDFQGLLQKLLNYAGITPSGNPDTVVASDYWDALTKRINSFSQYLVDSGAADAYVVGGDPAYTAYATGMKLRVKIANTNTGASTINVDSLGAKNIVKYVSTPLAAGDLPAGTIVEMQYDGTNFQLVAGPVKKVSIRDQSRGLVIKNNTTNPNYQMDVDADEIILHDGNGNPLWVTGVNLTLDISSDLDTGSEANATWYYIWVTSDGITVGGKFSLSSIAPTIPSNTYKALVGAIYNDGSGNFISIVQNGNRVVRSSAQVISAGTAGTYTSIDISGVTPITAKEISGRMNDDSSGAGSSQVFIASTSAGLAEKGISRVADSDDLTMPYSIPIMVAQQVFYKVTGFGRLSLFISGWGY